MTGQPEQKARQALDSLKALKTPEANTSTFLLVFVTPVWHRLKNCDIFRWLG
jgi:hypothetical protein